MEKSEKSENLIFCEATTSTECFKSCQTFEEFKCKVRVLLEKELEHVLSEFIQFKTVWIVRKRFSEFCFRFRIRRFIKRTVSKGRNSWRGI